MVPKKNKSKRVSGRQKYKIARKVREYERKKRKEERNNPNRRKKLKKDPGVPNLLPFKDQVIAEAQAQKERAVQDQLNRKLNPPTLRPEDRMLTDPNYEMKQLLADAERRARGYGVQSEQDDVLTTRDNSKKAYYREFKKVVDVADVILEVLDARDPLGCRAKHIEELILNSGSSKKIILVLNKIDLVPKDVVEQWLKYLRGEYPTIAFKASTQTQRHHIKQGGNFNTTVNMQTSECLGADNLIKLLQNYCRNKDIKTAITVGVIGYPNVGKSSLINSLKRSKVCGVGSTPGFTTVTQEIILTKNIKLIDCPGIVFNNATDDETTAAMLLRNCIKVEQITDPITVISHLLTRCTPEQLMTTYNLPRFQNVTDLLTSLAKLHGKLKKGGIADLEGAAREMLKDWNSGKIRYFTEPPSDSRLLKASVVDTWSKEFNMEELKNDEAGVLNSLTESNADFVQMQPSKELAATLDEDDDEEDYDLDEDDEDMDEEEYMEEDDDDEDDEPAMLQVQRKQLPKKQADDAMITDNEVYIPKSLQMNKSRKQEWKKLKKDIRRTAADMDDDVDEDDEDDVPPPPRKNQRQAAPVADAEDDQEEGSDDEMANGEEDYDFSVLLRHKRRR